MFRKPFKVKSNTRMKGSEKKKLKFELLRSFPVLSAEDLKEIIPTKDDLSLVKILTHSGESVHFYCNDKLPILFFHADKLYPTLYLLWKFSTIIPFFTTVPEVLPVMQGGADFMVAGIVAQQPEKRFGKVNKNDIVYINLTDNRAAVAVGECALSSHDMYMSGGRGKCVIVLHTHEDELCKFASLIPLPQHGPTFVKLTFEEESAPVTAKPKKPSYASSVKGTDILVEPANEVPFEQLEQLDIYEPSEELLRGPDLSSTDDVVVYCFLKALNMSVRNVKLPLLISNFYKLHMIPACPEGKTMDIKKSKFKKMSKLIQEMEAENLIKVEEPSPGVQSIVSVNYSHRLLSGFVDVHPGTDTKEKKADEPKVSEKFSITAAVLPLFSYFMKQKGESLTEKEVRSCTAEYIRSLNLPLPEDPSMVRLNGTLKSIVAPETDSDVAKWEEVMNRVLYKMSRRFKVTTNASTISALKEQKGKLPLIDIRIANKSGNKKVTLVNNLETYGINIEEFAKECQRGVAASATVNQISGLKSSQLQIQGNQINFIEKILTEKYNIPRKYMNGLQFAPKKK